MRELEEGLKIRGEGFHSRDGILEFLDSLLVIALGIISMEVE